MGNPPPSVGIDRRHLLRAGGAVLVGATLAGCSGDDDDGGDDEALAIERVTFTDGEPRGYRDYDEAGTDTFEETDVVWIYYEPVGFDREDVGGGEAEVDLSMRIAIEGPDGEELFTDEDRLTRTVPEDASVDAYFAGNFQPPIPAEPGEYTAVLTVEDHVGDEEVETTTTFEIDAQALGELAIENVTFVESRPDGYRQYTEVEDDTYTVGERLWLYFEPAEFYTTETDGGQVEYDLVTSLVITNPEGTDVFDQDELLRKTIEEDAVDEQFIFWTVPVQEGSEPGEYTATLGLEDQLTDRATETTVTFTVQERELSTYAETFVEFVESNIDVEIVDFDEGDVAAMAYDSAYPMGTEGAVRQIAFIAASFADSVGDGWGVDRLVATVSDGDGEKYQFQIGSETALAYDNDELTDDQYRDLVLDTLEPA